MTQTTYLFHQGERAIFVEIYFPKRAAYYGAIYNALRFGYDERIVKDYLRSNIQNLLDEFSSFSDLFNPFRYVTSESRQVPVLVDEALHRIDFYVSSFKGWSVYTVDGVWFNDNQLSADYGKTYEEATQVVRIMFRFRSQFTKKALAAGCSDVLRSTLFWVISQQGRLQEHKLWGDEEKAKFIDRNGPWPPHKYAFVDRYFTRIARQAGKWMDDCALFAFGYLVRKFWVNVVTEKLVENEIWVTSLFNLTLNVVEEVRPIT